MADIVKPILPVPGNYISRASAVGLYNASQTKGGTTTTTNSNRNYVSRADATSAYNASQKAAADKKKEEEKNLPQGSVQRILLPAAVKWNPPMVSSAYFRILPGSTTVPTKRTENGVTFIENAGADANLININPVDTSKPTEWFNFERFKKGYIVQDREFGAYFDVEGKDAKKNPWQNQKNRWGFRFLYNPTTINMAYGYESDFDPNLFLSGKDTAVPITPTEGSNIQFEILLNRVEDMKYINWNATARTATQIGDPYPAGTALAADELRQVYLKGTMWDVEYLLRTITGRAAKTRWRGNTADLGFLFGTPVVLRLGENLTYNVWVSGLSINHAVFNERMVPILSTVNLTCSRYIDMPLPTK